MTNSKYVLEPRTGKWISPYSCGYCEPHKRPCKKLLKMDLYVPPSLHIRQINVNFGACDFCHLLLKKGQGEDVLSDGLP
jgi:hypothetical protein